MSTEKVSCGARGYKDGYADALDTAKQAVNDQCVRDRHNVASLGYVIVCPFCYTAMDAIDALRTRGKGSS